MALSAIVVSGHRFGLVILEFFLNLIDSVKYIISAESCGLLGPRSWWSANMLFGLCFLLSSLKGKMPAVGLGVQAVPRPQGLVGCGGSTLRTRQGSKCKLGEWVVAGLRALEFPCLHSLAVLELIIICQCSCVHGKTCLVDGWDDVFDL